MWGVKPSVVVVDDDPGCRDLHTHWLEQSCSVTALGDGEAALETIDDGTDLVVLDREMPGLSGIEVLHRLRDRGFEGYVVVVTGVEPNFDLVEMPVDDYLVKPITERELLSTLDRLRTRADYHEQLRELFSLSAKKARLDVEKSESALRDSEAYDRLQERIEAQRRAVREAFDEEGVDWLAAFEACVDQSTQARVE